MFILQRSTQKFVKFENAAKIDKLFEMARALEQFKQAELAQYAAENSHYTKELPQQPLQEKALVRTESLRFFKFRQKSILKMMFLHSRRRHRLLLYFAFQKYKSQTYKSVMADLLRAQALGMARSSEQILNKFSRSMELELESLGESAEYASSSKGGVLTRTATVEALKGQIVSKSKMQASIIIQALMQHKTGLEF